MNEFERKPDGGLSAWIETYEAMGGGGGGGENDAEMLCLLLELRRRRETQEAAERERDELREQFDKLASVTGWNKAQCEQTGDGPFDVVAELVAAKAELARRDATAGEPVGFIHPFTPFTFGKNSGAIFKEETRHYYKPVYAAAPPAVVPPAISTKGLDPDSKDIDEVRNLAHIEGANWMREQLLELGAPPQKVVELPRAETAKFGKDYLKAYPAGTILHVLEAAGVKWEVKP